MAVVAPQLTEWEKGQIEDIDRRLQSARIETIVMEREHVLSNNRGQLNVQLMPAMTQRWRSFAKYLYEIFDLLYRLCYCHSQNNGEQPATTVVFPKLPTGEMETFVGERFNEIFGPGAELTGNRFQIFQTFMSSLERNKPNRIVFDTLHDAAYGNEGDIIGFSQVKGLLAITVRVLAPGGNGYEEQPQVVFALKFLEFVRDARDQLLKVGLGDQYVPFHNLVEGSGMSVNFQIGEKKLNRDDFLKSYGLPGFDYRSDH